MKSDEFEKQLRQRPLRSMPVEWRAEILSIANLSILETNQGRQLAAAPEAFGRNPWIELIRAWRGHFAGLSFVWLLIIAFNATTPDGREGRIAKSAVLPPEMILARQAQQQLLVEIFEPGWIATAEPPKPVPPRPRSDLPAGRRSATLGEGTFHQSRVV